MSRTAYFQLSQSFDLATRERVKIVTLFFFSVCTTEERKVRRREWSTVDFVEAAVSQVVWCFVMLSCRHKRSTHCPRDTNCCQLIHHGCISIKAIFVDFRKFSSLVSFRSFRLLSVPALCAIISISLSYAEDTTKLNIVSFLRHNNTPNHITSPFLAGPFVVVLVGSSLDVCLFRVRFRLQSQAATAPNN